MTLIQKNKGQGIIEYALILVLIAILVLIILALFGESIGAVFSNVIRSL